MLTDRKSTRGFTIVELLIVIVVIAILAAISIVAYNGIQTRARDTQRKSDVSQIAKILEAYYILNGQYPPSSNGSTIPGITSWSNTADASWQALEGSLGGVASSLPVDPVRTPNQSVLSSSVYNYAYFTNSAGTYCGAAAYQMYILVYRLESGAVENDMDNGTCSVSPLGPYGSGTSNYRVSKL